MDILYSSILNKPPGFYTSIDAGSLVWFYNSKLQEPSVGLLLKNYKAVNISNRKWSDMSSVEQEEVKDEQRLHILFCDKEIRMDRHLCSTKKSDVTAEKIFFGANEQKTDSWANIQNKNQLTWKNASQAKNYWKTSFKSTKKKW